MVDDLAVGPADAETLSPDNAVEPDGKAAKPEDSGSAPDSAKPAESARDKVQERFDKLTREKYDALRRADRLEDRLAALEMQITARAKPPEVAPQPPSLESVGFDEGKYAQAVVEYAKNEARQMARQEFEAERAKATEAAGRAAFEKRQEAFIKDNPDYVDKVLGNSTLPISREMAEVIRESDLGPQVAYFLADHPERAAAIAAMSPVSIAREIGRIEARLELDKAPRKPPVSQAPPPTPKIEATEPADRVSASDPDSDKLSIEDWMKKRNRQVHRRKG